MLSTKFELVINLKLNARLEVHDKLLPVAGAVMAIVASPLCHRNMSNAIRPPRIRADGKPPTGCAWSPGGCNHKNLI
jgi:hypothetical protein